MPFDFVLQLPDGPGHEYALYLEFIVTFPRSSIPARPCRFPAVQAPPRRIPPPAVYTLHYAVLIFSRDHQDVALRPGGPTQARAIIFREVLSGGEAAGFGEPLR